MGTFAHTAYLRANWKRLRDAWIPQFASDVCLLFQWMYFTPVTPRQDLGYSVLARELSWYKSILLFLAWGILFPMGTPWQPTSTGSKPAQAGPVQHLGGDGSGLQVVNPTGSRSKTARRTESTDFWPSWVLSWSKDVLDSFWLEPRPCQGPPRGCFGSRNPQQEADSSVFGLQRRHDAHVATGLWAKKNKPCQASNGCTVPRRLIRFDRLMSSQDSLNEQNCTPVQDTGSANYVIESLYWHFPHPL